jgi:hypothetical protein
VFTALHEVRLRANPHAQRFVCVVGKPFSE